MNNLFFAFYVIINILLFQSCYSPEYSPEDTIIPSIDKQEAGAICDNLFQNNSASVDSNPDGKYQVGDFLNEEDMLEQFSYCFNDSLSESSFSFSNYSNKIYMLEMSATW